MEILSDGVAERQFRLVRRLRGCGAFFFFNFRDFVEAALVASAEVGGGQENLNHLNGDFAGDDASAECKDIGVVVFSRKACGIHVMRHGRADAGDFVSGDGNANPGSADGDAQVRLFRDYMFADRFAVVRIIDRFFGGSSQVAYRVAQALQMFANDFLDGKSGVVGTDGNTRLGRSVAHEHQCGF